MTALHDISPSRSSEPSLLLDVFRSLRPRQWIKNGFIFAALIFASKLGHVDLVARSVAAFALFCILSSVIYLVNDVADREADRRHPTKSRRPIAAGRVSVTLAVGLALAGLVIGLGGGFALSPTFGLVAAAYLVLMLAYTFVLKHLVLIDVFALAGGFVLRAAAGAAAIGVQISPWLYLCTILLA